MKEILISGVEKTFVLTAISEKRRLDGRAISERRKLRIHFGRDWGSCHVSLGETRVLAQVSCEIQQPKATRPNEGLVHINVDISPMAAVHIEPGKPSDMCIEINRLLEKCIKESKCIDLESLCIVADEKVWVLRVDVTVLNLEGNISECASIAALAGLAHFKRPDVMSTGERIVIYDASEKDPLPTSLHHFPICLCYAIFNKGNYFVADPTEIEERIAEAHLSVGMNGYRELCGLHLKGKALTNHKAILQCVQKASTTAADIVQLIKKSLQEDEEARSRGEIPGFAASIQTGSITSLSQERMQIRIKSQDLHEAAGRLMQKLHQNKRKTWDEDGNEQEEETAGGQFIVPLGAKSAELVSKDPPLPSPNNDDTETTDVSYEKKAHLEKSKPKKSKHGSATVKQGRDFALEGLPKVRNRKNPSAIITLSGSEDEDAEELEVVKEVTKEEKEKMKLKMVENIVLDDSEEEETTTLTHKELENPKLKQACSTFSKSKESLKSRKQKKKKGKSMDRDDQQSRGWYPKQKW